MVLASVAASRRLGPRQAASYARFSSDKQDPRSITDQQRECRAAAERDGLTISPELAFSDQGISGARHDRAGLDALLASARAGHITDVYFESLSRLARASIINVSALYEFVHSLNVRVVSIRDGIDTTANQNWEYIAAILGIQNEQYLRNLATQVHRGQTGVVLDGFSVGDYPYGYISRPVVDPDKIRTAKNAKLLMQYDIDPAQSDWVKQIYEWFTVDKQSISWISRQLNERQVPRGNRAKLGHWSTSSVRSILQNEKYIGRWTWGKLKNHRNPLTGKQTQRLRSPGDDGYIERLLPDLAIVDAETFAIAADRLSANRKRVEKRKTITNGSSTIRGAFSGAAAQMADLQPRHLLSHNVRCGECGSFFTVCGRNSRYMGCDRFIHGAVLIFLEEADDQTLLGVWLTSFWDAIGS